MFVVTSRGIEKSGTGLEKFGKALNAEGSSNELGPPIFDNCSQCHADNGYALRLSRIKPSDAHRARLRHYIKRLDSRIAHYINLTDSSWVKESHSPFGGPARENEKLRRFFSEALTGESAEEALRFKAEGNW